MKKIRRKAIIIPILIALLLFLPLPSPAMNDGGSMEFRALTYTVVKWHRLMPSHSESGGDDVYSKTSVYWFPHNFKDIDDLWELEMGAD